jgi:hypothetical protein
LLGRCPEWSRGPFRRAAHACRCSDSMTPPARTLDPAKPGCKVGTIPVSFPIWRYA